MRQAEKLDHLRGGLAKAGIGAPEQARRHRTLMLLSREDEVVAHGKLRKNLQQLKCPADAETIEVTGPRTRRDLAVDAHFAGARLQLPEHAIEQRRFARAVRSDNAENLAGADLE